MDYFVNSSSNNNSNITTTINNNNIDQISFMCNKYRKQYTSHKCTVYELENVLYVDWKRVMFYIRNVDDYNHYLYYNHSINR